MKEYIEREAAIEAVCEYRPHSCIRRDCGLACQEAQAITHLPAADVREVARGEWERLSGYDVFGDINCKCSACGEDWWQGPGWFRHANYCPNCGAEMRGKQE